MSRDSRRHRRNRSRQQSTVPRQPPAPDAAPPKVGRGTILVAAAVIIAAGLLAYWNSFDGVFLLDDEHTITANENIRRLWPPWQAMFDPEQGNRPVAALSLAMNYRAGELDPWGYHAVNLGVHLAAALVLFGLVRRTLQLGGLRERFGGVAVPLALAVALLWTVHPLQTESVTYVIQRAEAMVGLALLATLYFALRGFTSGRPVGWTVASVVACALGMGTKEVMLVAPLVVLLYDRALVARSFGAAFRRRRGLYVALAATWAVLLAIVAVNQARLPAAGFRGAMPWTTYALTQLEVVAHYVRLAVWPDSLQLTYEWAMVDSAADVAPWALVWGLLLAAGLWGLLRRRGGGAADGRSALAFAGLWFFATLAPTSSVWPIEDVVFEHRMYLPLAAVAAVVTVGGYAVLGALLRRVVPAAGVRRRVGWTLGIVLVAAAAVPLGAATVRRNALYHSARAMWVDVVNKDPDNLAAHNNLGNILAADRQFDEAVEHYKAALRTNPNNADAHNNLGVTLAQMGNLDAAIDHLSQAVQRRSQTVRDRPGAKQNARLLVDAQRNLLKALRLRAWQLATRSDADQRDGRRALELARRACDLTGDSDAESVKILAAAHAEAGQFQQAADAADRAAKLFRQAGRQDQAENMARLATLFRRGRPYHRPAPPER